MSISRELQEQITQRIDSLILAKLEPQERADIIEGLSFRVTKGGIAVPRLHYSAHPLRNPDTHPEWKESERRKYTSQAAWNREQEIVDEAGGGELVFADVLVTHWKKIVIEDPGWRPDPDWWVSGGFDHGKTNPTCLLRTYHGFDGTIYFAGEYYMPGKEIWQHAPELKRMRDFWRMEVVQADPSIFSATLQQGQRPGEAIQRAKSYAELYEEQGIKNLMMFGGDLSDVSFAGRLQTHWADLEHRAPSVRIVCPVGLFGDRPQPGLHQWGCPNLLWELMRTRRVQLTSQQQLSRNLSEAIVDKDNHARDAMKYLVMSYPEPAQKTLQASINERVVKIAVGDPERGIEPNPTLAAFEYARIHRQEVEEDNDQSSYCSRSLEFRRKVRANQRRYFGVH